jgi:endo-1,4-beta-xylanase
MKSRITVILIILFAAYNITMCSTNQTSLSKNKTQTQTALKTVYQDHFLVGNIINNRYMAGEYLELLTKHFNTVTCENQMKPEHLAPKEKTGQYNWGPADSMLNLMTEYGIKVHGHTLVWHNQTHAWMTTGSQEQVRTNMINHINTVLAHYKGKVFSWDVVNEAVKERITAGEDINNWKNQLRTDSGWYKALGADYIELAFRTARAADPDIMLYYNDYNMNNQRKARVTANMIKEINDKYRAEGNVRNLIDGVGFQAHYGTNVLVSDVRSAIEMFIELGLKIDISEMDIETKSVGSNFGNRKNSRMLDIDQKIQAMVYANLFTLFKEYSRHITRVTMWGMDDENSWKSLGNPCLFDGDLNPKQAFFAVCTPDAYIRR